MASSVATGMTQSDRQGDQGVAPADLTADLHATDVDARIAEDAAHDTDDPRLVVVAQERHVLADGDVDVEAVDLDELLHVARSGHRAGHDESLPIGLGEPDPQERAVVGADAVGGQADLDVLGPWRARAR